MLREVAKPGVLPSPIIDTGVLAFQNFFSNICATSATPTNWLASFCLSFFRVAGWAFRYPPFTQLHSRLCSLTVLLPPPLQSSSTALGIPSAIPSSSYLWVTSASISIKCSTSSYKRSSPSLWLLFAWHSAPLTDTRHSSPRCLATSFVHPPCLVKIWRKSWNTVKSRSTPSQICCSRYLSLRSCSTESSNAVNISFTSLEMTPDLHNSAENRTVLMEETWDIKASLLSCSISSSFLASGRELQL